MSSSYSKYAAVIVDQAVGRSLDYGIPDHFLGLIVPGSRVLVPLRGRSCYGYVLGISETAEARAVKPIKEVCSEGELITPELFNLALWVSKYYCAPLSKVLKSLLPASVRKGTKQKEQLMVSRAATREELQQQCIDLRSSHPGQCAILEQMLKVKKGIFLTELLEASGCSRSPLQSLVKKGLLTLAPVQVDRSPLLNANYLPTQPKTLNKEQHEALEAVKKTLDSGSYGAHLLFGITGSGKTEVYLQAIAHARAQGKGVLLLVPEIALTEQAIERFLSRFQEPIALLHYRLSDGERFDSWNKIRSGEQRIAIGARSAIFAPMANLGLIIVDEEHENSYKQNEEAPCYHARDVAVMRAAMNNAAVILGSATPSLESYTNALRGKYQLNKLMQRADSTAQLPAVKLIDMKREYEKAGGYTSFSEELIEAIKKRYAAREQTILFLNRRGYHTSLICGGCGEAVRCSRCDISLTYHKKSDALACHLCGYQLAPPPRNCPSCRTGTPLKFRGVGTEQVEAALHALLPELRTLRLDADTTRHKGSHQQLLRAFATGKADLMIGTQMVAKGLHFPSVTLVGVLNSDAALNIPDFRASETVFQLITQVAGRAGRSGLPGEVLIQTMMPDNGTLQLAAAQDFPRFYEEEIAVRESFNYPPFAKMAKVAISGSEQEKAHKQALALHAAMERALPPPFELYPVDASGYGRINNRYRYQFLVRGPAVGPIGQAYEEACRQVNKRGDTTFYIDINPLSTFF